MPFHPCPSGCGRFLSADEGHDRCLQCLGHRHAEAAFVDDSCVCCGLMSMISLRSRLSFMKGLAPSAATRADFSGSSRGSPADALGDLRVTIRASSPGTPPRTSYSSRSEHPVRFPGDFAGLSHGAPSISFGAPSVDRMSIAASGDGFTSSEDEGAVGLPPSGVVATAAPDPELTAMLARAAVNIGLEVNRPPSPEPSRLDDWFLGAGRGSQPRPAPVPFFPEVHEELTSLWMAPFTARSRSSASSVLTTLDGGVARGYAGIPQVERAVAVHLCPRNTATWRNRPRLPSKACKLTAALAAKAYSAAGQAASALHAMAILQVQVPTRGWCRSCARRRKSRRGPSGRRCPPWWSRSAISGSTWQRWRTSTRHAFSTPPSPREGCSATPSRASPSSSRRYSSRPRRSSTSCPGVMHHPPLPPGPGLSLPVAVSALLRPPELLRPRPNRHIGQCVEPLAGERRPPRPSQAPTQRCCSLLFLRRRREQRRSFPWWRAGRRIFCFVLFLFRMAWQYRVLPFGLSLSPRVFTKIVEERPYPVTGSGRQDPQLPRRLAYPSPIQRAVGRSQGLGATAPQPVGASGQLGKEQALPCAENLFSRCGVRLGEYDGTLHGGTRPSSAELPEFLQR